MFINQNQDLIAFCERARKSDVCAVDTEFVREHTYKPVLSLLQMATKDEVAVIDPLADIDLLPVAELFRDKSVVKVFHAAQQDIEILHMSLGVIPTPFFDTQIAEAFVGQSYQISLSQLVESYEGVHLPKSQTLSDWLKRPLSQTQIKYAENDVVFLPGIYKKQHKKLLEADKLAWVMPEIDALVEQSVKDRNPREQYTHLKGIHKLTRRQLSIAREICAWREHKAKDRDIPRQHVISDSVVVELCRLAPKNPSAFSEIRWAHSLSKRDREELVAAILCGLSADPADYPLAKRPKKPAASKEAVINLMSALVRVISERENIAAHYLADKSDLLDFINDRDSSYIMQGWRKEILGVPLSGLIDGEIGLTVKDNRIEII